VSNLTTVNVAESVVTATLETSVGYRLCNGTQCFAQYPLLQSIFFQSDPGNLSCPPGWNAVQAWYHDTQKIEDTWQPLAVSPGSNVVPDPDINHDAYLTCMYAGLP
jgi:hypothetical protein